MAKCKNGSELFRYLVDVDGHVKPDNVKALTEACQGGQVAMSDFAEADVAKAFGVELKDNGRTYTFREDAPAVSSTLFPKITGQLLFSDMRRGFDLEANVFTPEVPVIPSRIRDTEIVPSITAVDPDSLQDVAESESYPRVAVTEEYFTLPSKQKHGGIIEVTKEALTFDKTGMLSGQAMSIGRALGQVRENEIIDCLIGQTNNYIRNGTAANTYTTSGVINNQSSTPLNDWTDLEQADLLFADILDPNTSEPIMLEAPHLIVSPAKKQTALNILRATQVRSDENASAGTRSTNTLHGNPVGGKRLLSSIRLLRRILAGPEATQSVAEAGWFYGDLSKLLAFYEVWPLALLQKGEDSEAAWDRDVVLQYKASYFGVCAVREKRCMVRMEDTAW